MSDIVNEKERAKMSRLTRFSLAVLLAGTVSACAQGTMVRNATIVSYRPSMLNYAAGQGAMKTEIIGNPFVGSKDELDRVVTSSMTGAHFGPRLAFATSVSPQNKSPYRVVMIFNPTSGYETGRLCSGPEELSGAPSKPVRVAAAFCSADRPATYTAGSVSGVDAPTDPAFRDLIRQITIVLFPLQDPTRGDDGREKLPF